MIALVEINVFLNTKFLKLLWRREIALAIGIGIFYFCFVFTKRYIHIISVRVQNKYWRCVRFNFVFLFKLAHLLGKIKKRSEPLFRTVKAFGMWDRIKHNNELVTL